MNATLIQFNVQISTRIMIHYLPRHLFDITKITNWLIIIIKQHFTAIHRIE